MTDKERLEDIKGKYSEVTVLKYINDVEVVGVDIKDLVWLINRVEELELEINDWREEVQKWQQFYEESEESHLETIELLHSTASITKRYRETLEFYADEEHYKEKLISEAQYDADGICISNNEYAPPIIYFDNGEKARQALKGESQ